MVAREPATQRVVLSRCRRDAECDADLAKISPEAAAEQRAANYMMDKSADALAALMRSLLTQPQRRAS